MTSKQVRRAGFILILIWFGVLVTWMLSLSQLEVSAGIRIYGSRDHIIDQSTVIRVVGFDTKANYPLAISDVEYRWVTTAQTSDWLPLEFTERLAWQTECKAPSKVGLATLEVRAKVREDVITAQTKLAILAAPPEDSRPKLSPPPAIRWETQARRKLFIAPLDGAVLKGFENTFALFVNDLLPPPSLSYIDATQRTQIIALEASDIENVYLFKITPNVGEINLTLSSSDMVGRVEFPADLAYFKVLAPDTQLDDIRATIESRDQDSNILVDLWRGPYWLRTSRLKGQRRLNPVRLTTGSQAGETVWVQAYTNPFNPSQARGGQHVFVGKIRHQLMTEWRTSPQMAPFQKIENSTHFRRFLRGRLTPSDHVPRLIADSSRFQTPALQAERQHWMTIVSWLLALSTLGVIIVVICRVVHHRKRLEIRFEAMDEEDDLMEHSGELKTSLRDGVILLIFVGILMAGVGWLFLTARW